MTDIYVLPILEQDSGIRQSYCLGWNNAIEIITKYKGPYINCWALREVLFDADGEPIAHRTPQFESENAKS